MLECELQKFSVWIVEWYMILTQWLLIILDVIQKPEGKKYFLVWLEPQGTVVFIEVPVTEILFLVFFIVSEGVTQNSVFMFESSLSFKFKPAVPWGWNMAMFWQQGRLPYVAVIKKLHWCQSLKSVF